MPARGERIEPAHEWHQLEFRVQSDGQRTSELIRPMVLFGQSASRRAARRSRSSRASMARLSTPGGSPS